jgi:hypothetical protein
LILLAVGFLTSPTVSASNLRSEIGQLSSSSEDQKQNGNTTDYLDRKLWYVMQTAHVPMNCTWGGSPICCALIEDNEASSSTTPSGGSEYYPRIEKLPSFHHLQGAPAHHHTAQIPPIRRSLDQIAETISSSLNVPNTETEKATTSHFEASKCHTKREYIPSSYEVAHIEKAVEIAQILDFKERQGKMMEFIEQDVENTNKWLRRVDFHMRDQRSAHEKYISPIHPDDLQYMSRFNITSTCNGITHSWIEWIEPLTVHARHPNGLIEGCRLFLWTELRVSAKIEFHAPDITSPDYVLIQDNDDYHHQKLLGKNVSPVRRRYFFDAGANYFNTGTAWFTCAYLQV